MAMNATIIIIVVVLISGLLVRKKVIILPQTILINPYFLKEKNQTNIPKYYKIYPVGIHDKSASCARAEYSIIYIFMALKIYFS